MVIDEFFGWLKYNTFKQLLDRYPLQVETKAGQANFIAKKICFTSNTRPEHWYRTDWVLAVIRRIDTFIYIGNANMVVITHSYDEFKQVLDRNHIVPPSVDTFNPPGV